MKTKLLILVFILSFKVNAQLVQSLNSNYNESYKKTSKELIPKPVEYANPYHKLLVIKDSIINPYAAYNFQNICIDSIISKEKQRARLVAIGKKSENKKYKHSPNIINSKCLKLTDQIKDYEKARDYFGAINSLDGSPRFVRRFLPLRSVAQAQRFYLESLDGEKKISFVKEVAYQNNFDGSNSLSSSILTAVFPFFNRRIPLKVNVASTITQNNDTISNKKIADKISKGGMFNIGFTYTLFYSNWKYLNNNSVVVYVPLETKFHIDDVKSNSNLKETFFYNEISTSVLISFDLLQNKQDADLATLFIAGKLSYFNGGNQFCEKISENKFSLFQVNAGLKIAKKFTVAINLPVGSSSKTFLNNQSATLGLVFETGL